MGARDDEAEIRAVLGRYARGVDRLDMELVRSCYFADAAEDRGRYVGGVDGFIEWLRGMLVAFESTWHQQAAPLIELEGDVAWVETYCMALHRLAPDEHGQRRARLIPSRYCDRFERREGRWLIARRVAVYEDAFAVAPDPSFQSAARSRRDRQDPAYQRER